VAVIDMGASAIRLLVAEAASGQPVRILEEASRGVLLGKDTFTHGRLGAATVEATLKALEGFRRIMDGYGVVRYRAVATSAVREAQNSDAFLDRVRLRTGIDVEVIDGSEENRLTYMAVRETLRDHPALTGDVRFAAQQMVGDRADGAPAILGREPFVAFCDQVTSWDVEQLVEQYHLPQAEAETLVPALVAYRELLQETAAQEVIVPDVSLRAGLLLDVAQVDAGQGIEDFSRQVLSSAVAL